MQIDTNDPAFKAAAGAAGTALVASPLGMPVIHGIAGIAVAGLGIFAAGAAVTKLAEAFVGNGKDGGSGEGDEKTASASALEDRLHSSI